MARRWTDEELVATLVALVTHNTSGDAMESLGIDKVILQKRLPDVYNLFCSSSPMECLLEAWVTGKIKKHPSAKQLSPLTADELDVLKLLACDKKVTVIQRELKKSPAWVGGRINSLKSKFEIKETRPEDKHVLVYAALSCGIQLQ